MREIASYSLVIPTAWYCMVIGGFVIGGVVAWVTLWWAPRSVRTSIGGFLIGLFGIAVAVAFEFGVFRLLIGKGSFTVGPFLATTIPLLTAIWGEMGRGAQAAAGRDAILKENTAGSTAGIGGYDPNDTVNYYSSLIWGRIAGLLMVCSWFFR